MDKIAGTTKAASYLEGSNYLVGVRIKYLLESNCFRICNRLNTKEPGARISNGSGNGQRKIESSWLVNV